MSEETKRLMEQISPDDLLALCMATVAKVLTEDKKPQIGLEEFRRDLSGIMKASLLRLPDSRHAMEYSSMIMEEMLRIIAPAIIALASIVPERLGRTGVITEKDIKTLRRGVEDSLVEIVVAGLKKAVLSEHLSYNAFMPTKEGS